MTEGRGIWSTIETRQTEGANTEDKTRKTYSEVGSIYDSIRREMKKVVVGQDETIEQVLIALLTDSHALLEGFPGLGKTLIVRTFSRIMELDFKRIQCTPDIMPSDITGTYIIVEDELGKKTFRFEKGPVFTNIVLADEINRATPKAQSALLECMQERQVTAGNKTYELDKPFFVLATENPIEMEGTYPLPEAQVDRFLLKILVDYPKADEEDMIVRFYSSEQTPTVRNILSKQQLISLQNLTRKMPISDELRKYAIEVVTRSRPNKNDAAKKHLDYGASPRASIGLVLASKARALLKGRNYVNKDDVRAMAYPVLRHRLILNFESERKGITTDNVISEILDGV